MTTASLCLGASSRPNRASSVTYSKHTCLYCTQVPGFRKQNGGAWTVGEVMITPQGLIFGGETRDKLKKLILGTKE